MSRTGGMLAMMLAAGLAVAGGFRAETVPADADWVLHVDMAGIRGSDAGRALIAHDQVAGHAVRATIRERFALDPIEELDEATLHMRAGETSAVVVFRPTAAGLARVRAWRAGLTPVATAEHAGLKLARTADLVDGFWVADLADGRVVAGQDLDRLRATLDALNGRRAGLAAADVPVLADRAKGAGALVLLYGRTFESRPGKGGANNLAMLRKMTGLCLAVGVKDGGAQAGLTVATANEEEAERLLQTFTGMVTLAGVMAQGPDAAQPDPLRSVRVTREGLLIRAAGNWSPAELMLLLGLR